MACLFLEVIQDQRDPLFRDANAAVKPIKYRQMTIFLQISIVLQKSTFYLKGHDHFDIRYSYLWAEGSATFYSSDLSIIWIWVLRKSWFSQNEEMNFLTDIKNLISSPLLAPSQNTKFYITIKIYQISESMWCPEKKNHKKLGSDVYYLKTFTIH